MRYDIETDSGLMLLLLHARIHEMLPRLMSGDAQCFSTEQYMRERDKSLPPGFDSTRDPRLVVVARNQLRSYPDLVEVRPDVWTTRERYEHAQAHPAETH